MEHPFLKRKWSSAVIPALQGQLILLLLLWKVVVILQKVTMEGATGAGGVGPSGSAIPSGSFEVVEPMASTSTAASSSSAGGHNASGQIIPPASYSSPWASTNLTSKPEECSSSTEREARSVALEKAYVHDVYQQIACHFSDSRYRAWPRVKQFLLDLEPGSFVCDVGKFQMQTK